MTNIRGSWLPAELHRRPVESVPARPVVGRNVGAVVNVTVVLCLGVIALAIIVAKAVGPVLMLIAEVIA